MVEKYKMKIIKEFYEFTEDQEKKKTREFLENALDKALSSYAINMDFTYNEVDYFPDELDEDLKKIVGFEEKFNNFINEMNNCLKYHKDNLKISDLPIKFDLYDAFINKTKPIINKIIFK